MEEFLNEEYVDKESILSYEKSDIIVTIFFAIIDLLVIIISSLNLKSKNKTMTILKSQLVKIFIIDIIMRVLYTKKYSTWNVYKEILLVIMNGSQFYIVISFLDTVADNPKSTTSLKQSRNFNKRMKLLFLFFFVNFSYGKLIFYLFALSKNYIININKSIILIQSFGVICLIYMFYKDFKHKVSEIVNNLINPKYKKRKLHLVILGSPLSLLLLYYVYETLKVISIFIKNHVFLLYANIALNILKDTCKYFVFFVCEAIIYVLNQIQIEKDKEFQRAYRDYNDEEDIINA